MPAIDANRSASRRAVKRSRRTPRPAARPLPASRRPAPQTRRPDVGGARPIVRRPSRPTATQRARAQQRSYVSQGKAVEHAANRQRRTAARRIAARRAPGGVFDRNAVRSLKHSERKAIGALAALRASNPTRYDERRRAADRNVVEKVGHAGATGLTSAATALKRASGSKAGRLASDVAFRSQGIRTQGAGNLLRTNAVKDAIDLAANAPTTGYLTGAAVFEAAKGRPQRAKRLVKDYAKTSAIVAAAQGNFKEAERRAKDHPVSTALELSGAKAVVGRGAGAAMRSRVAPKGFRNAASTERANLRLYPHARPGEGPEIARRYSKDVINKGLQRAAERRAEKGSRVRKDGTQRRPGRDPNVAHGQALVPALPGRMGGASTRAGAPVRSQLIRRVDTRQAQKQRVLSKRVRKAEDDVKHALRKHRVRSKHAGGVQLIAEGVARAGRDVQGLRRDLRQRQLELARVRPQLAGERLRENRAEAKHIRELLNLDDHHLTRMSAAAEDYARAQRDVQARGERVGTYDQTGQSKRFMPALQTHIRRPAGEERVRLTPEQQKVAAKVLQRRARRGQDLPKKASASALNAVRRRERQRVLPGHNMAQGVAEAALRPKAVKGGPDPLHLEVAAKNVVGLKLPVRMVPLSKAKRGTTRGGYAGIQRDPFTGANVHKIYFNPDHGVGAKNAALWHELHHAKEIEEGRGLQPTTQLRADKYRNLTTEQKAEAFANKHMDKDLWSPPTPQEIAARRPRVGQAKGIQREDFSQYLAGVKTRRHVPGRKLNEDELPMVAKVLQRRQRRGQATLSNLPESGPTLVTQRPTGRVSRQGSMSSIVTKLPGKTRSGVAFEEGSRDVGMAALKRQAMESTRHVTLDEHSKLFEREFGVPAGKDGRRYARSAQDAMERGWEITHDPVTGELKPGHAPLVPVEAGRNRWTLMPEDVVARIEQHQAVNMDRTPLSRATALFKDVVLTSSSPARWIGGNVADIGMRTAFEGITPLDIVRGRMIVRRTSMKGLQGEEAAAAISDAGVYHAGSPVGERMRLPHEHFARTVAAAPWRLWKTGVYGIERAIEDLPTAGSVGKQFRRDTTRTIEDAGMKRDLKTLLKLHDQQIDSYATRLATDRALEARIQKATEDVMGRWGKVSPTMRRALGLAPFAQWLGAATRYVFVTLPVHHPIKTGIISAASEMTDQERRALGLSYFVPRDKQVYDYQMGTLPLKVGRNKYGPVVEGVRTARMTSFGTAAGFPGNLGEFALPQFSGALDAWAGQSFTGEPLVYPDWWPDVSLRRTPIPPDERVKIGVGALMESTVPFASAFRRTVLEKGRPSEPFSTILTPAVRKNFDKDTKQFEASKGTVAGGILEWLTPFAPPGRVYTYGAGKAIEEQNITGETLDKWRKRPRTKKSEQPWFGPGAASPTPTPTPSASGNWFK